MPASSVPRRPCCWKARKTRTCPCSPDRWPRQRDRSYLRFVFSCWLIELKNGQKDVTGNRFQGGIVYVVASSRCVAEVCACGALGSVRNSSLHISRRLCCSKHKRQSEPCLISARV